MVDFWLRARKFWVICSGPNNRLGLGVVRAVISRMTRSSKSRQIAWIILIAQTSCVGSLWCNWVVVVQPFRSGITAQDSTGAIRVIYERHLAHVRLTAWSRTSWWRRPRKLQHMASTLIRASSCHVFRNHLIRHICDVTRRAVMEHAKHVLACSASQEALYKGKIKP